MSIKVNVKGRVITAKNGEILSDVLFRAGFSHPRPCGGRGICGKCAVLVDGNEELACRYTVTHDITVEMTREGDILSEIGAQTEEEGEGSDLVLDIGTTTLAMALVDKNKKRIIKVITSNNPQRQFGADVISRIDFCRKKSVSELARIIRKEVISMIKRIGAVGIDTLHVAGNTTMLHIFAGADPSSMGEAPYTPKFLCEMTVKSEIYGIAGVKNIRILPSISAFVGADLVAGINFVGRPKEKHRLLIDLGTNAEIILFSKDRVIATAAAAGPCFEGANISCGMSATNGAVYAYDGEKIKTVGNALPKGICGTGLVDIIAVLLKNGIVDESGYMEDEEFFVCDGVSLTQGDVRQYQLAKSAIYSATVALLKQNLLDFSDIEALYISGGFAAKINIDNAVYTGLLPTELKKACVSVGNSSLLGTVKSVFEESELSSITENASYVDLSSDALFSELFIENMTFE